MPRTKHLVKKAVNNKIGMPLGVTGLKQSSGYIMEEYQPDLQGVKAAKMYKEMMESDETVGSVIFAIEMTIRSVPWTVVVDEDYRSNPEYEDKAEFVREVLKDMDVSLEDFVVEVLSMIPFGFSLFEIIYKRRKGIKQSDPRFRSAYDDGKIGLRNLAPRSQDTIHKWAFHGDEVIGAYQTPPYGMGDIFLPMDRCVLFRSKYTKNNPEGKSALRSAYKAYHFKKSLEMIEAIGVERELTGLPIVELPDELLKSTAAADIAVVQTYVNLVKNVRINQQAGVVIPSDTFIDAEGKISDVKKVNFKLMASSGTRTIDTGAVLDRHSRGICRSVLADWVMLGVGERGSQALSRDKSSIFMNALEGWLSIIAAVFNRRIIPALFDINGFDRITMPKMQYGKVDPENVLELSEAVKNLGDAGMPIFPDDDLEAHVRARAGFPDKNPVNDYIVPSHKELEIKETQANKPPIMGVPNGKPE